MELMLEKTPQEEMSLVELISFLHELEQVPQTATEGFGLTVWAGMISAFNRLKTIFKENMLRAIMMLKQSELYHYDNLHSDRFKRVSKLSFDELKDKEAFMPTGMLGSYLLAVKDVVSLYEELNCFVQLSGFAEFLKKLQSGISRKDDNVTEMITVYVMKMKSIHEADLKAARTMLKTLGKQVNTSGELDSVAQKEIEAILTGIDERIAEYRKFDYEKSVPSSGYKFSDCFDSVNEYVESYQTLLGQNHRVEESKRVYSAMENSDELLDTINQWITGADEMDVERARMLAAVVRIMAITVSHYGFALATQMKLEHNIILTTQSINRKIVSGEEG